MSISCVAASLVTGIVVAALSVLLPRLYLAGSGGQGLATTEASRRSSRWIKRILLACALVLLLAAFSPNVCGPDLTWTAIPGFIQSGLFVLIAFVDVEYRRLIPAVLLAATASALLLAGQRDALWSALAGGLAGLAAGVLMYAGGLVYRRALRRYRQVTLRHNPLGGGDALLAGVCGLHSGWPLVLPALLAGVAGAAAIALLLLLTGRVAPGTFVPYAPFLLGGTLLALHLPQMATWLSWLTG